MPYLYECPYCHRVRVPDWRALQDVRRRHWEDCHEGRRPEGERWRWVRRERPFRYREVILVLMCFVGLILADWLWRHL